MKWSVPINGDVRVKEWFAFIPVKCGGTVKWLQKVKMHQTYLQWDGGWCNDWFVDD